jgi:hypothetical protein
MQETARLCKRSNEWTTTGYWRLKGIQCVRSTCPSHNYHTKVTSTSYLLLQVTIHFFLIYFLFLTCRCARHGVTAFVKSTHLMIKMRTYGICICLWYVLNIGTITFFYIANLTCIATWPKYTIFGWGCHMEFHCCELTSCGFSASLFFFFFWPDHTSFFSPIFHYYLI